MFSRAKSALKEVTVAFRSAVQRASGGGAEGAAAIDDPTGEWNSALYTNGGVVTYD